MGAVDPIPHRTAQDSAQLLTSQRACREARPQRLVSMQSQEAGSVPCKLMLLSALRRAGGGACLLLVLHTTGAPSAAVA